MTQWQDISTAPKGRDSKGKLIQVLLIGRYPSNGQWTDIVHSWWNDYEESWARWRHSFPPTHFQLATVPDPPTE